MNIFVFTILIFLLHPNNHEVDAKWRRPIGGGDRRPNTKGREMRALGSVPTIDRRELRNACESNLDPKEKQSMMRDLWISGFFNFVFKGFPKLIPKAKKLLSKFWMIS